jgi:molybdenum cofactor cytidylyltransferase
MGASKQLLPIRGRPAIVCCLEAIRGAGIDDIVVVLRPDAKEIRDVLESFPVNVVFNELPGSDMAASVRAGLAGLEAGTTGIFVCLCDYPLVRPSTLTAMRREHRMRPEAIILPMHHSRKGHPALFPRRLLEEIAILPTLRDILHRDPDRVVTLDV